MRHLPLALLLVACGSDPSPAAVDAAQPDALGVDVAAVVDAAADTSSDVTQAPDATPDAAVDVAVADVARDASAADAPGDAPGDAVAVADVPRDASPDADPLDTRATSLSISARSASGSWSMPSSQSCMMTGEGTVAGPVIRFGADFNVTSPGSGFGVSGILPDTSAASLSIGGPFATGVTAMRGTPYLVAETTRRVNARASGMVSGVRYDVIILGCEVR